MKNTNFAFVLFAGVLAAGAAPAMDMGLSGDIGTTGAGLHLTIPAFKDVNARFGFNALNYKYSSSTSNVNYDIKLKLQTFDALLDWYPMSGNFRLTGGLVHNGNKISVSAKSNSAGSYTLNGNTYTASQAGNIDGTVDFRSVAPYLGMGWGNAIAKKGWEFTSDLGLMAQGSPHSTLTSSGCTASVQLCNQLANDVAAENASLNDKMDGYKLFPVVRIGVSYKF